MVAMRKGSLIDGTTMQVVIPNYFHNCEETWGTPMYSVHRVDLHNQLRLLATQKEGQGFPVDIQVRSKVVDYVSKNATIPISEILMSIHQDAVNGKVTVADNKILQTDLIVVADGVHSTAVRLVLGNEEIQAGDTGWACMRWLVPTEELLSDPNTSAMIQDSVQRYFIASQGAGGLVWYPCRKLVVPSLPFVNYLDT